MDILKIANDKAHRIGRIWMGAALLMMISIPVVSGIILGTGINWKVLISPGIIGMFLLYIVTAIGEVGLYSSMLGTDGMYLAFVTGNLSNLKIPCVINARDIIGAEIGSEENDIASTISIAVSSMLTVIVIAIGVLLISVSGLKEFLASDKASFLSSSFGVVVFALFGALGGKYLVKYPRIAVGPFIGLTLVCVILVLVGAGGIVATGNMLFVGVIVCVATAYFKYFNKLKAEEASTNLRKAYGYSELLGKELSPENTDEQIADDTTTNKEN
ncbi:MAG: hypothetical protein RR033_06505 [Clostridia bacterium]